ncbi:MAG: FtsQ-type POTRA domain-containing protein, partial [Patescibacteria group bacterium]|nr:FtsQ-type POTRA domain-containing protein [Patescibacteria group bacterium]
MARDFLPQSRVRLRRRKRRLVIAGSIAGSLLGIFGGLAWLSWAPFLRITQIQINGAQTLSTSTITAFAAQKLSGAYWGLFAKNDILIYPKSSLAASLTAAMPAIASADVHAQNFNTITIAITERQPKALWCGEQVSAAEPCFLLDQGGAAYAAADSSPGGLDDAYQKYYGAL